MAMGMFDFSIGANIMLSAIVGSVFAGRLGMGYFGLILGCVLTGTVVGFLNGFFYVNLRIPSMIVTTKYLSYTSTNEQHKLLQHASSSITKNGTKPRRWPLQY